MKILSQLWQSVQEYLFPYLEEEFGVLTEKQERVVAILEVLQLEKAIQGSSKWRGCPQKSRLKMARAYVVKAVYDLASTRLLLDLLDSSPFLRRICGYERKNEIPHESTFSRAFEEYARSGILQRAHEWLIGEYQGESLVGHLSKDSTAIEGNEKPARKESAGKAEKPQKKKGRRRKGEPAPEKEPTLLELQTQRTLEENLKALPAVCDRGCKKNSQGYTESWTGYKLHVDFADGGIPISCLLTSASAHDSQAAIPLMQMSANRVQGLYDLMDAAYDAEPIRAYSLSLGHQPIIDSNPRRGEKKEMDPAKKERYKERTTAERGFGRLKEEFGACRVKVKGAAKVMAHLMFGVLALTAEQLLRRFA